MHRVFFGAALLCAVLLALACNFDDSTVTLPSDDPPDKRDVSEPHDAAQEHDVLGDAGPTPPDASSGTDVGGGADIGNDVATGDVGGPQPQTGLRLRAARMETLQEDLTNGRLRISNHSIEGNRRTCTAGRCINGRILP